MTIHFMVFSYCMVINTYSFAVPMHRFNPINITNFRTVNLTELKSIIGPQADKLLAPIFNQAKEMMVSKEASEEEKIPLPQVFHDEQKNIFFDLWVTKGRENRLMADNKGQLCASILASAGVRHSLNLELWRFISSLLQVRRDEVEIILDEKKKMARRVVVKGRAISVRDCKLRLHANLQPFTLEIEGEAGQEESAKLDELFLHTEIRSELPTDPLPELSEEDTNPSQGPNYIKNPITLDRVLQDLMPNKEIIIRGRLLKKSSPNFIARPLLENYQGDRSLKIKRKLLEGVHTADKERCKSFPSGPLMKCPGRIPGLTVVDTISQDGSRVINRRVFVPLFQNNTHDFIDELDYTEVKFQTSL